MEGKLLSIIVPVYNAEAYFMRCMDSLVNQTYQNVEIILVDDGSVDSSGELCDACEKEYKNITVFHQKNSGANMARKAGVLHAKGEYIAFIDSDDWVEKDLFEKLMAKMVMNAADMITTNITVDTVEHEKIQYSAIKNGVYTQREMEKQVYPCMVYDDIHRRPGIFAYLYGKIFKREILLESMSGLDRRLRYGEDGAVVFPLLARVKKLVVTDCPGYHYVQHPTSMTHNLSLDLFHDLSDLEEYLTEKFKELGRYELVETQIHYFIRDLLFRIMESVYKIDCGRILCVPPYEIIPPKSKLAIYGAGKAGKEFVRLFLQNHYAEVIAWVDRDFGRKFYSYKIESPESLKSKKYDYVLIALTDEKIVSEVMEYLHNIGIERKKILWKEINWG